MKTKAQVYTIISSRSLNDLFHEIRKYPALDKATTDQLSFRISKGDEQAYVTLFCSNLRLVITIAKRYIECCRVLELQDLFQAGSLGLMKALERYDPARGITLCSMASVYIHNAIRDIIRQYGCSVNVPSTQWESFKDTYSELRLSEPRMEDSNLKWEDTLNINDHSLDADSRIREEDKKTSIRLMLSKLNTKEQEVIRSRFGLEGREMQPWEIAERLHLTEARINQIINEAIAKMRAIYAPKKVLQPIVIPANTDYVAA